MGKIQTINIHDKNYPKLLKEESLYVDKIIEKTKLPAATIASTLANLEIKDKVKKLRRKCLCN